MFVLSMDSPELPITDTHGKLIVSLTDTRGLFTKQVVFLVPINPLLHCPPLSPLLTLQDPPVGHFVPLPPGGSYPPVSSTAQRSHLSSRKSRLASPVHN